jgi:4-hydroxybenzoate polyprenyltransferase|tara:strand:+ start:53 stop:913 length:861 start_codon:yes stop_codon:yes gene_type:complete
MTKKLIGLGKLMRLEKPIGTFLLLWPTLSAFMVLKDGSPTIKLVIIFCIGTFLMRSAGCVINDLFDKDFDGKVERTKERPIVTGEVSSVEAIVLFFILIGLSAVLLIWTNKFTVLIAGIGLLIAVFYPLTKRFFKVPQLFLGLAFSWGILMVSAAELEKISFTSLIMFSACFFWILAYDTAYALSDKEGDLSIGLNSSAITFGKNTPALIVVFHLISLCLWSLCALVEKMSPIFYLSIFVCLGLVFIQFLLVRNEEPDKCLKAFKQNNWIGFSILVGTTLPYFLGV